MTADAEDSQPTAVISPGSAPPRDAPPGHPHRKGGPPRPVSRTWWVLPYCAGALAVFVVAGLIIGLRYNSGTAKPAALSTAEPLPAEMFPDALFGQLTADIQAGNETAFLSLASPAARPAIRTWWNNLAAIGFTTGAVLPTASVDGVHIDSHGNGTTVILAGVHSPLDPKDLNGKPYIPMTRYQIGLHFSSPDATGQITSWKPLDNAPWDLGSPLYVRKAADVVVAGPAADRALIDQTLPIAETAASYDIGMMRNIASDYLMQSGFVVFVGSAAVANRWLATVPQAPGWPPEFLGARAVEMLGPTQTADVAVSDGESTLVDNISDKNVGGVRVVLTPTEPATKASLSTETQTLVRDFMLDMLANQDEQPGPTFQLHAVPSWAFEGIGVAVQNLFEANPDPTSRAYDFKTLTNALNALPRSYRSGTYPTASDLFGPSLTTDEAWGDVAASTYEYVNLRYNLTKMMVSAMVLWLEKPTPFGNVFKSGTTPQTLKFFGIHSIRLGWRPWLSSL
jgi:hypothetical protein